MFHKHHELDPLHRYQLEIIFLFVFGFFLFFPFYLLVKELEVNIHTWQWYFFFPWITFYIVYSLVMRSKIPDYEMKSPLKRPIGHWVLLGLSIMIMQLQPNDLQKIQSVDLAFIILSIFLADSYWDFKKLSFRK